jgi:hypothetical protein
VTTAKEFVEAFVARFPVLRPSYEEHLRYNGELLPHIVFGIGGGFTDQIVDAYQQQGASPLDWRRVLEFLEAHFDQGDREVDAVVETDFLEVLPWPKQSGYALVEELPERLRRGFNRIRPLG